VRVRASSKSVRVTDPKRNEFKKKEVPCPALHPVFQAGHADLTVVGRGHIRERVCAHASLIWKKDKNTEREIPTPD
jgi:hypothetical protein